MQHIEKAKEDKNAVTSRGIVKKRDSQEIAFTEHSRQAPDPNTEVADARPGPSMDQSAREPEGEHDSGVPDVAVNESTNLSTVWGIAAAQRTHRTFELAGKIGKRPVSVLLDSGSTGNFVSAQMCTAQK